MFHKIVYIAVGFFFSLFFLAFHVFASTLSLHPQKINIKKGESTNIIIKLDTQNEEANAISAYLSYPEDKIEVTEINPAQSFAIEAENSYGGGVIKISRGNINPVSGNLEVATINIKAKKSGAAKISFITGSAVPRASDSSDSLNLSASLGGSYEISNKFSDIKTPDSKPNFITNINIAEIASNSAVINWETSVDTDSYVEYGLDNQNYFLNYYDKSLVKKHKIKLTGPSLLPGAKYHFRIKSKDAKGNLYESDDMLFQLKGYQVKLKIVDKNNKPIKGKKVIIYSEPVTEKTNDQGEVIFDNIIPGKHKVIVDFGLFTKKNEINVEDSSTIQFFNLTINFSPLQQTIYGIKPIYLVELGGFVFVIVFILIVIHKDKCVAFCKNVHQKVIKRQPKMD